MNTFNFIINPSAGGKDGKKIKKALPKIEKRLVERGVEYFIHMTKCPNQATELTQMLISNGATDIVVVGGDGTLHEVLNGFSNFDNVNLGIIPCGTGNDFASALKLPLDPVKALDLILDSYPKHTDFMQMPTVRGFNVIGTGIDVDVLKRYEKKKHKSKLAYTTSLIQTLFNFNYTEFDAEIDGEAHHFKSFIAGIANGHRFGGGVEICPVASPTDNLLDFVAVDEMPKLKIIGAFLKLKKGKLLSIHGAHHLVGKKIKIIPKGDYTVNVDGELYDNIPFEIEVVSNKLKIYRP